MKRETKREALKTVIPLAMVAVAFVAYTAGQKNPSSSPETPVMMEHANLEADVRQLRRMMAASREPLGELLAVISDCGKVGEEDYCLTLLAAYERVLDNADAQLEYLDSFTAAGTQAVADEDNDKIEAPPEAGSDESTWSVESAEGSRLALSEFVVPTGTGLVAHAASESTARIGVLCDAMGSNHRVGVVLPQTSAFDTGTVPARIEVDGRLHGTDDVISTGNVLIIGSTENGLVDRIIAGNNILVRIGWPSTATLTWNWSLRGSSSAIGRACD